MIPDRAMDDSSFLFGALFFSANTLQVLMDRELAPHGITAKQWYLSAITGTFFDSPPTLKEVAGVMGHSHQNIKQVALKLQEKGFMALRGDEKDGRVTRLHLTHKSQEFWETLDGQRESFLSVLFSGLSASELEMFRGAMTVILENMENMKGETL